MAMQEASSCLFLHWSALEIYGMEESTDTTVFTQWDVFCVHNTALRMRFSKQNQWGSMTAKLLVCLVEKLQKKWLNFIHLNVW